MNRLIALVLLAWSTFSQAMCFAEAANRYGLSEGLLRAIATVESAGNPAATNLDHLQRTKTYDIGLMQVNSSWLPRLARMGITEQMLRDPCQNLMVGSWILSHHLRESGDDWNGVGSYNASCRTLNKQQCESARYGYSWKVYRALMRQSNHVAQSARPVAIAAAARQATSPTTRFIRTVEATTSSAPDQSTTAAFVPRQAALQTVVEDEDEDEGDQEIN